MQEDENPLCRRSEEPENEENIYDSSFRNSLISLANEVYGMREPREVALRTLRYASLFYDADWCGVYDVDMMLKLLKWL